MLKSERQTQSVYPHSLWEAPAAMSSLGKKGKSANVSNSIQIKVYVRVSLFVIKHFLFISAQDATRDGSSKKVELGEGYLVGIVTIKIISNVG